MTSGCWSGTKPCRRPVRQTKRTATRRTKASNRRRRAMSNSMKCRQRKAKWLSAFAPGFILSPAPAIHAQDDAAEWDSLTGEQQEILSSLQDEWDGLAPGQRGRLATG